MREEILAGFAATDFLSISRIEALKGFFGNLESAWKNANVHNLKEIGIPVRSAETFCEKRKTVEPAKILEQCEKVGAKILFYEDSSYPELLSKIDGAPPILFFRGKELEKNENAFAVVGSRKISMSGKQITEKIVPDLVRAGMTIVSGLARGVDAVAHRATLMNSGRTIAVLGNGIDAIYPSEHRALAEEIIEKNGTILSEFVPGVPPNAYHFPRRNRIVSGLCLGTLVVEGEEKSGSLITAQYALEHNREVFAIPGAPMSAFSRGPNRLIQKGNAKLVLDAEDILAELPLEHIKAHNAVKKALPENPIEKAVLSCLTDEPRLFDEIVRESDLSAPQFAATLTILEMKGFVSSFMGNMWART